ncbi:peroxisomal targeting signal 2 receptor [Galendromus occidentalis]|uniref:Peroxin-7 n=1 Tax=Galendromus occidentalis TaxID=34638 RepID=A0AAJ6VZI6_9ACAR|nr:peroxisomal targeting signal 2 receptor [Galendromus occidentalis]
MSDEVTPPSVCRIPGWHGFAVKFSPFNADLVVCAGNQNYGIQGRGALLVLTRGRDRQFRVLNTIVHHDALFDFSFSEVDPNVVCAASADGHLIIFHLLHAHPVAVIKAHSREISSVQWNPTRSSQNVLSSSWDGTINLVDPSRQAVLRSFKFHSSYVYDAVWAPRNPNSFCSASGDGAVGVWDLRAERPQICLSVSPAEVLSVDWSAYDPALLSAGSVDNLVSTWDIRKPSEALHRFPHRMAVKKVRFNPFLGHMLASVSYDFTTQVYNLMRGSFARFKNHTEFVYGLDWSLRLQGEFADCGWDQRVCVGRLPKRAELFSSVM